MTDQLPEEAPPDEPPATDGVPTRPGWRSGAIPGWLLALGIVVFGAAGLGLAAAGGAAGIAAAAVLEAAVVVLLYSWCAATAPR